MKPTFLRWTLFAAGVAGVALLPLAGRALRGEGTPRCALDGVALPTPTTVRMVEDDDDRHAFCCIDCARNWLDRTGARPVSVLVTDEVSGAEVPLAAAWLVRSRVPALAVTGSRIHAFAQEEDARRHIDAFGGTFVSFHIRIGFPGNGTGKEGTR